MAYTDLAGMRVLVVEDEFFIADDLRRELQGAGAAVIGPVPTLEEALAVLDAGSPPDAAVLDINLGGRMAYPVADRLLARSIPFVLTSGYDDILLERRYPHVPRCQKPTAFRCIADALGAARAAPATDPS